MLAAPDGPVVIDRPFQQRRRLLEVVMAEAGIPKKLVIAPATSDLSAAEAWLCNASHGATDGVVAKELTSAYQPGERAMIKVKQLRTADCVSAASATKATAGKPNRRSATPWPSAIS
jgi:ATP-dependent DNA ligase